MIELLSRRCSAPLTNEDVHVWARVQIRNDVLWYHLRELSAPQDRRDAHAMFSRMSARDEPRD